MGTHSEEDCCASDRSKPDREVGNIASRGPKGAKGPVFPITYIRIFGGEWPTFEG